MHFVKWYMQILCAFGVICINDAGIEGKIGKGKETEKGTVYYVCAVVLFFSLGSSIEIAGKVSEDSDDRTFTLNPLIYVILIQGFNRAT